MCQTISLRAVAECRIDALFSRPPAFDRPGRVELFDDVDLDDDQDQDTEDTDK